MKVTECGETNCTCGIRCPNCETKFVTSPELLCNRCTEYLWCDACGNNPASVSRYGKAPAVFVPMAVDRCQKCDHKRSLNLHGICEPCLISTPRTVHLCVGCDTSGAKICATCNKEVDVLTQSGKCIPCSTPWEERRSLRRASCVRCRKETHLNSASLCKQCVIEEAIRKTSFVQCNNCNEYTTEDRILCTKCESKYDKCLKCDTYVTKHSYFCIRHQPICVSCGISYQPHTFEDKYCGKCSDAILKGKCPDCGKKTESLSPRGACNECETHSKKVYECPRCGHETTSPFQAGELCAKCKTSTHKCLKCRESIVSPEKILCQNCEMARKLR